MLETIKDSLWQQFGASIDMLENAVALWPEAYWNTEPEFFYNAYHCLVLLDYYLTIPAPEIFNPPLTFTIKEADQKPAGVIGDMVPDRVYSQNEMLGYLRLTREKCHNAIAGLTAEKISERWVEEGGEMDYAVLEILLYNMRHVQHHAAQLNMLLRHKLNNTPSWVWRAGNES